MAVQEVQSLRRQVAGSAECMQMDANVMVISDYVNLRLTSVTVQECDGGRGRDSPHWRTILATSRAIRPVYTTTNRDFLK
jgi:hypothetical protein